MKTKTTLIFEYWKSGRQFYCHLRSPNGKILMASEGYKRMASVKKVCHALGRAGCDFLSGFRIREKRLKTA